MEVAVLGGKSLDGMQFGTVRLNGKHNTGARGLAVEVDGASPAHAMLAANMSAGEAQILTQEIDQELARLTSSFVARAIHSQVDCYRFGHRRAFNGRRERDATRGPSEHESDGGDSRPYPAGRS